MQKKTSVHDVNLPNDWHISFTELHFFMNTDHYSLIVRLENEITKFNGGKEINF
jgi:hypothetical protein